MQLLLPQIYSLQHFLHLQFKKQNNEIHLFLLFFVASVLGYEFWRWALKIKWLSWKELCWNIFLFSLSFVVFTMTLYCNFLCTLPLCLDILVKECGWIWVSCSFQVFSVQNHVKELWESEENLIGNVFWPFLSILLIRCWGH